MNNAASAAGKDALKMELDDLRKKIDSVDEKIVELLNERYNTVIEIGTWKKNKTSTIYVPEREKAVLERLTGINKGPMSAGTLRAIYREIMSGALSLEYPLRVAYLGPEATFTHLAAMSKFGRSVGYIAKSNTAEIFRDVCEGKVDYGCVPVENSTEGVVNNTLDMFVGTDDVMVCAEINMRIHHSLLSNCAQSGIRKIYAHAQTLSQCRCWLEENFRSVELVETSSNTKAAEFAAKEENAAAIASTLAAEVYGLNILCERIEDNVNNTTRFLVISRKKDFSKKTGNDKTSVCFSIKDRVGALYDCLLPFKEHELTLSMIESRPSKQKNWEYVFFIDLLGHIEDPQVSGALEQLRQMTGEMRILGSYPKGLEAEK